MKHDPFISRIELGGVGPRIGIKDCIDIAGLPTCIGSRALLDVPPATSHAQVVECLLRAGWQISGKLVMHELAFGMTGINAHFGTPHNPQDPSRITGGSSSGSAAAVGQELVDAALGTDTGGSIRLPAACCGIYGLKPSAGLVSRKGVHPASSSLDCVGPFSRDMPILIQVMQAIVPGFHLPTVPNNIRVGLLTPPAEPAITDAVTTALASSGWQIKQMTLPSFDEAFSAAVTLIGYENWQAFGKLTRQGLLGEDVEARLLAASAITEAEANAASRVRERFIAEVDAQLQTVDCLALATLPRLPPRLEDIRQGAPILDLSALVRPFNLSGHPALNLPIPLAGSPLKTGLQLVGRRGADAALCVLGSALSEHLQPHHSNKPQ